MDARIFVVLAGLAGAAALQPAVGDRNGERRRNDFRYTPDPAVLRVVAGAHRSSAADVLWLRALPDMSREFGDRELKRRWLEGVFVAATELDPAFYRVYLWGADYLALLDRDSDASVRLLERGIERNPRVALLHAKLGMEHWHRHERSADPQDLEHAMAALRRATELPGCDGLTLRMVTALEVKGRRDWIALAHWERLFTEATGKMREVAERELLATKERIANRALREFAEREGRPARSVEELRDPSLIEDRALDFVLDGLELTDDGRARLARLEELELAVAIATAEEWSRTWRDENGRWPELAQVLSNPWGRMPPPPEGRRWEFREGRLELK